MNTPISIERDRDVAVIVIDHPPVNALALPVREALLAAIENLDADTSVRAIVLHGAGRHFVAGADVREFEEAPKGPLLNDLLLRLERCSKPVIAVLHGATLGGGAELALASHYRCATKDLQFGFPEVKLGLIPGAGGTVRLPHVSGFKTSLDLMTSGMPVSIDRAIDMGVVDHLIDGNLRADGVAYARKLIRESVGTRPTSERQFAEIPSPSFFVDHQARLHRRIQQNPATAHVVFCTEQGSDHFRSRK